MKLTLCWKTPLLGATLLVPALQSSPWLSVNPAALARAGTGTAVREGFGTLQGNPALASVEKGLIVTGSYTHGQTNQGDLLNRADALFSRYTNPEIEDAFDRMQNNVYYLGFAADLASINQFLTTEASALHGEEQGTQETSQGSLHINWNRWSLQLSNRKFMGATTRYHAGGPFYGREDGSSAKRTFFEDGLTMDHLNPNGPTAAPIAVTNRDLVEQILVDAGVEIANQTAAQQGGVQNLLTTTANLLPSQDPDDLTADSLSLLSEMVKELNAGTGSEDLENIGTVGEKRGTVADSPDQLFNLSGVHITHFDLKEAKWGYSFSFIEDHLHIAPTLKYMHGRVSTRHLKLTDPTSNTTNILDAIQDEYTNVVHSNDFDIDLGFLVTHGERWSHGLTITNLLSPTFDAPERRSPIRLDPTMRIGTAYRYSLSEDFPGTLAFDLDILENESPIIEDYSSRLFSVGIEQGLSQYLALHLGTGIDTAAYNTTWIFSGGLGLRIKHFYLDTAISSSHDSSRIQGERVRDAEAYGFSLGYSRNL